MELVAAGKITRTFGKEGEVIAVLYDSFPAQFNIKEPLYLRLDGLEVPLFISRFSRRGRSGALLVFDDIDNEARCGIILGQEFFIRPELAEDNAATGDGLEQFVGFTAVMREEDAHEGAETTGMITGITGNDANPLFAIEAGGAEILIPATDDMVSDIDETQRTIRLVVPPGLLDL